MTRTAYNTWEKCKTISRSLLKSEHALVSSLGNQWQPTIQGLTCPSVCVYAHTCVCVCVCRLHTRSPAMSLYLIIPDTELTEIWVIDTNNCFFLAFPFSCFLSLRFRFKLHLWYWRAALGWAGRRLSELGICH